MKSQTMVLLNVMTVFTLFCGQTNTGMPNGIADEPYLSMAFGDTVNELPRNIMTIFQDNKNNYWFGSWVDGLYRYDGKTIIRFTTEDGLWHNRIEEVREDKAGNLYFNTSGGVNKFDGKHFTKLNVSSASTNDWKMEPDDLWFKCNWDSALVYRYDGSSLHPLVFPETQIGIDFYKLYPRQKYPRMSNPYAVYTIYTDSKGNVWFGTAVLGACRFNGKSLDWISEPDVTEIHNGPSNGVRSIIEDAEGKFWFSNSLYRYDVYQEAAARANKTNKQNKNEFSYIREKSVGSLDGIEGSADEYMSAVKDQNGELWIVMYAGGVWRYNPSAPLKGGLHNITHYDVKDGNTSITLFSIYQDHQGGLWLGTHESGAYKFNGKSFEPFKP